MGTGLSLFMSLPFLPVSSLFLPTLGQKSIFQAVVSCLLWVVLPLFSFISSFFLGRVVRKILLLYSHLAPL